MTTLYVPEAIPSNYKYITNITSTYYDLYSVQDIANTSGYFYRVYYSISQDLFEARAYSNNSYFSSTTIEINRNNDILARQDAFPIIATSLCFVIIIVFLCNILTSIVKKGGLFHA